MNSTSSQEEPDFSKDQDLESLNAFQSTLSGLPSAEEKLRASLTFMRNALSQSKTPYFKGFWEIRKICLPFFREEIASPVRSLLWEEYVELTREGRRLKHLLDEESAFAIEQIDMAIAAFEQEVALYHGHLEEALAKAPSVEFSFESKILEDHMDLYYQLQGRLQLLNLYAIRVNAFRKELIKTDMRVRLKNKFFQRLSTLGDQVFPPRKELIKEISEAFVGHVEAFVNDYFGPTTFQSEKIRRNVFFFREEIKAMQALAKIFTLNTHAFTKTRELLSECWDRLKGMEKELKKEFAEQRVKSSENATLVREKMQEIAAIISAESLSDQAALKHYEDLLRYMRQIELNRYDVKLLKEEIEQARAPFLERIAAEEEKKRLDETAIARKKEEKLQQFKDKVTSLREQANQLSSEQLQEEMTQVKNQLSTFSLSKTERQQIERSMKGIRDQLEEKREQTLLSLSDDDRAIIEQLRTILEQRKQRRQEIKAQVEEYRKILGGSTLDFEKAIEYNELMQVEKQRLEKADEGISEIESKIRTLRTKPM